MANCKIGVKCSVFGVDTIAGMGEFAILFLHLIVTLAQLAKPGGLRSVVAESVLVRHQLLGRKRAQPARHGSDDRGVVRGLHPAGARSPLRYCSETFHSAAFPQRAEQTKVPHLVFAQTPVSAWSEGTGQGPHRCRRCHETA